MTWRTKTRKSVTRGRGEIERVLPVLCLVLTLCIHNGKDVHLDPLVVTTCCDACNSAYDDLA